MGDLWAPDKDANTYGARKKKKLGIGDIKAGKSYVPDGLTAAQYQELRKKQETSKKDNYQRNMIGKVSKGNPLPARIRKKIPIKSTTRKSHVLVVSRSNIHLTATVFDCTNAFLCLRLLMVMMDKK